MKLDTNSVTEVIRPCHIEAVTISHSWVLMKSQVSVLKKFNAHYWEMQKTCFGFLNMLWLQIMGVTAEMVP